MYITSPLSPDELEKESTNGFECWSRRAGVYLLNNLRMPYVTTEADARGHTQNSLKTRNFTPFSKYYLVFQNFWFEIPSISIEILGFSFEILNIWKICNNRIP